MKHITSLLEHNFPKESFIGGWYIPKNICDNLISHFRDNVNHAKRGRVNWYEKPVVDLKRKDSYDLVCKYNDNDFTQTYTDYLQYCLVKYVRKYEFIKQCGNFSLENATFAIQHYPVGGGFKTWHFERQGMRNTNRVLVFMTFLNDVDDGGTEFFYQNITAPAIKGLTLIWPPDFTHAHRGQISNTKEKYILTGWYAFDKK